MSLRVYLAGPEVFLPDAEEILRRKRELCAAHGLVGVAPLDGVQLPLNQVGRARGLAIQRANEQLMAGCELGIANATPFRGPHMDPGTAYEIGYLRALGRPVRVYTNRARDLVERVRAGGALRARPDGELEDAQGLLVEDFGFAENLMVDGAAIASGADVERHEVADAAALYRDLTAFERCVASARELAR